VNSVTAIAHATYTTAAVAAAPDADATRAGANNSSALRGVGLYGTAGNGIRRNANTCRAIPAHADAMNADAIFR
jgi:hypothetical protein